MKPSFKIKLHVRDANPEAPKDAPSVPMVVDDQGTAINIEVFNTHDQWIGAAHVEYWGNKVIARIYRYPQDDPVASVPLVDDVAKFIDRILESFCQCGATEDVESTYCGSMCPACLETHCIDCEVCAREHTSR